jgi:DNA-binding winged helix-turn-helix (wHTH) protein/TolB-like protein/Flp pilus assembly protein TadD
LYEFGKFRFDLASHLLLSEEGPIPLTPKAFDVLLVLVQNGMRLTTKEELMTKVWPDSFVEEANLTVTVSALRKALGETTDGKRYIETVPKKGYRFVAAINEVKEDAAEQAPGKEIVARSDERGPSSLSALETLSLRSQLAGRSEEQSQRKHASNRWILSAVGAFLILVIVAYLLVGGSKVTEFGPSKARGLAVLPFQNLGQNTESDFLGYSLADAVITKLGYVSQLSVRPSYAVQKYKAQPIDIPRVARELKVDALLTGSFLREGDDIRIGCQLVDANAESILWKGTFDLKYEKLLTVQDEVATQIIRGLELTLSPSEVGRLRSDVSSVSPLAYEYYLRGVDLYANSDFPMAIRMLEKSIELAPNYSLAWANLGRSYTANASFQLAGEEQYQKAQIAFERALNLQSDQIDARIYMANMFTDTGHVEKAVPLLREALRTNPNHAEIHWELGYAYRFAGMLQESVVESELARRLDPSVKLNSSMLNGYLYLGQYDRFLESLPDSGDQPLIVFYRGFGEYYKKNWDAAARDFDRAYELDRTLLQAQIGRAMSLAIRHQVSQGEDILLTVERRFNKRAVGDPEAAYKIAQGYTALGDATAALRVLNSSVHGGFFPYPYLANDPLLDSLRHEPEFLHVLDTARQRHLAFAKAFF